MMQRNSGLWLGWLLIATLFVTLKARADNHKPSAKEAKIGVYIDIVNSESNHLLRNYDDYTSRVKDLQKGPTCKEGGSQQWVSSMGESAPERYAAYRKALMKAPKLDVDASALEMLDALEAVYKPANEASEYYFEGKFKTDNCKRGLELHPLLMANWTKYIRAERVLRAFLDQYTDERDAAELKDIQKKNGKALHYYHRKVMIDGKALIRVADTKQPDLAEIRARLATFEATLSEGNAVVEKQKKTKDANALYEGGYEQMLSEAGQFRDTVTELIRVLDNEAKDPKAAARTNGRPIAMQNLVTAYNALVEQSNHTMYTKSMK